MANRSESGVSFELIGIPYSSMAKPGGIADAIRVLREAGLAERIAASRGARHRRSQAGERERRAWTLGAAK
jgi:hypothetical protein